MNIYRGVLGARIDGEIAVFQVSEKHEDLYHKTNITEFLTSPINRFFGDYNKKIKTDEKSVYTAEPYIVQNIEVFIIFKIFLIVLNIFLINIYYLTYNKKFFIF